MMNSSLENRSIFDQFVYSVLGLLVSLAWPGILFYLMTVRSDERVTLMRPWHEYLVVALVGIVVWLLLKNNRLLNLAASIVFPVLSIGLIYYLVNSFASRGATLYIGNIFYQSVGMLGMLLYASSILSLMFLSDLPRRIPFGTPIFIFVPYFNQWLSTSGSFWSNLLFWMSIVIGSLGFFSLIVDLIHYLRWEFHKPGERHA